MNLNPDKIELVPIVDDRDMVLDFVPRQQAEEEHSRMRTAYDILFNPKTKQILLQQRSESKKKYPGFYTVSASGGVSLEDGGNYGLAVQREIAEELGILAQAFYKIEEAVFFDDGRSFQAMGIWLALYDESQPIVIDEEELAGVLWIAVESLKLLIDETIFLVTPFGRKALQIFLEKLPNLSALLSDDEANAYA